MDKPMPKKVELVAVDAGDAGAVDDLVAFVNAHYHSELPLTADGLTGGHYRFFWALRDGERVGCTAYVPKTPYLAESVKTVVDPARRRERLGAAISQAIEDQVRADGFKKIMSTILIDNIPMIVIKLRQGYVVEGIHMDHEKPGLHEYSLGKVFR
ncbi:MAG TPA: GNAT family N-acetyltransferase [Myxococcota bacterium]